MKNLSKTFAVALLASLALTTARGETPEVRVVYRHAPRIVYQPVYQPVETVVTQENRVVETIIQTNTVEKIVEVEKVVEVARPVTNTIEKVVEKVIRIECPVTNTVEKVIERPVTSVVERIVFKMITNVVERAIHDFTEEDRLRKENAVAAKTRDDLEAKNTLLSDENDRLRKDLAEARDRCMRLERIVPKDKAPVVQGGTRQAQITSKTTYYDRKEGFAVFDGRVHVDDERYQMHADKAYVFMDGTNDLKRLVAMGHVALTNEAKRAYGTKASYYRQSGMVILYGDEKRPAEVRDETNYDDQVVVGRKIKFWIDKEQVEVLEAVISAPVTEGALQLAPKF